MKTAQVLESTISKGIIKAAKEAFPGIVIRKRHVSMGIMGDPDIYGCFPNGVHFEIEVKRPGNRATTLQLQRISEWTRAGAVTGLAYSVEEAMEILRRGATAWRP